MRYAPSCYSIGKTADATKSPFVRSFSAVSGGRQMAKRELINTGTDKRYVRRDDKGRFKESDDVGKSLSRDVKTAAKTKVKAGQGDKGDRKR